MHISVYRDSSPKNENDVINYLPSCRFKPARSFIYQHKLRYYWWNPRAFWPCIDSLEYLLSTKKTKKMTLFNNFFSSMSVFNRCPREYHGNVFFALKNYSCRFTKLLLNHWCHMDYFNDVLTTFLGLERVSCIAVFRGSESFRILSKIS